MEIEIPALETQKSLVFIKQLTETSFNEPVNFIAAMPWVRPFGMLITASTIRRIRERHQNIPFRLEQRNGRGNDYAGHMGFFKAISPMLEMGNEPGQAPGSMNYIPITSIDFQTMHRSEIESGNYVAMGDVVEKEAKRLAQVLCHGNTEITRLMTYLLREILRNIPEHAETLNAWICAQYWWTDRSAEIAIIDEGIGIKSSLEKNQSYHQQINNDKDAILLALKPGVSRSFQPGREKSVFEDLWANSGYGLYMVSEICKRLSGSFSVVSGDTFLSQHHDSTVRVGETCFPGTAIRITFDTTEVTNSQRLIADVVSLAELEAKTLRNSFKKASRPSRELFD